MVLLRGDQADNKSRSRPAAEAYLHFQARQIKVQVRACLMIIFLIYFYLAFLIIDLTNDHSSKLIGRARKAERCIRS